LFLVLVPKFTAGYHTLLVALAMWEGRSNLTPPATL